MTPLAQRLRDARESAGLTLRMLAEETDLSCSFVSDVERGLRLPSPRLLSRLARRLKIPEDEMAALDPRRDLSEIMTHAASHSELRTALVELCRRVAAGKISAGDLQRFSRPCPAKPPPER